MATTTDMLEDLEGLAQHLDPVNAARLRDIIAHKRTYGSDADTLEREIASRLDDLVTAARTIPVTPEHREAELIAEFLQQILTAMDVQESLRVLVYEYRKHAASVESQLAAERARSRQLRLTLRELASGWSRYPETSPLFDAWEAAERQLTAILDTDQ